MTGVDLVARPGYPGPFVVADAAAGPPLRRRRVRPRLLQQRDRARAAAARARPSRRSCAASRAAGMCRPRRAPSPSSRTRCCRAPTGCRRRLRRRYWRLGAAGDWEAVSLLSRRELEALFGPAERERFGPFTKSWISVRAAPAAALAAQAADVVADAVQHEEREQHHPDRAEAPHRARARCACRGSSRPSTRRRGRRPAAGTGTG